MYALPLRSDDDPHLAHCAKHIDGIILRAQSGTMNTDIEYGEKERVTEPLIL